MAKCPIYPIEIGLIIGLFSVITGCASYPNEVYYTDTIVVPAPDFYLFGGGFDGGRDVNNYRHRGSISRKAVHAGKSYAIAPASKNHAAAPAGKSHAAASGGKNHATAPAEEKKGRKQ